MFLAAEHGQSGSAGIIPLLVAGVVVVTLVVVYAQTTGHKGAHNRRASYTREFTGRAPAAAAVVRADEPEPAPALPIWGNLDMSIFDEAPDIARPGHRSS